MKYWKNKNGKAEVDFLFETDGEICPLEVKAGINLKSKSLHSFADKYKPPHLFRTSLRNFREDGNICNIPLYHLDSLPRIAAQSVTVHQRSEERRVGKECRSRWSPYH